MAMSSVNCPVKLRELERRCPEMQLRGKYQGPGQLDFLIVRLLTYT